MDKEMSFIELIVLEMPGLAAPLLLRSDESFVADVVTITGLRQQSRNKTGSRGHAAF